MSSKIYIVGMGPGTGEMMTPQADHALCGSDVIVGYPVYLKLLGVKYREKEFLSTPMKQEVRRGRKFVEYHDPGEDPQYEGMDWRSLRLVMVPDGEDWRLVGVVHAEWTT